ncbi:MAG TPA: CBS domain-containing protein, partial [Desulfobacteraceae bacterium]|nr:CBS domain-containing protein [Desulfobacteraceae bacterium]
MYVGRIMHRELVTVPPDTPLDKARDIIAEKAISHLLIVDHGGKLVGLVSDRDIRQSWASPATSLSKQELNYLLGKINLGMIMVKKIVTVGPETTIERAALIMQQNRISALPVLEQEKLVGIITTTDVMEVLLRAIGIDNDSFRFVLVVKDRVGCIADISRILKEQQINIRSLVSLPEKDYPGVYQLVMRVRADDGRKAVECLEKAHFRVLT